MWQLIDPGDTPLSEIWLLFDRQSGCVASNSDGTFIATRERSDLESLQERMGGEVLSFAEANELRAEMGMEPLSSDSSAAGAGEG